MPTGRDETAQNVGGVRPGVRPLSETGGEPNAPRRQSQFDLTMPETPSDPLDRLGEASASLAISLRGVGPARGRLCDVLNPHRQMKPIQYMMGRTGAGGFAE